MAPKPDLQLFTPYYKPRLAHWGILFEGSLIRRQPGSQSHLDKEENDARNAARNCRRGMRILASCGLYGSPCEMTARPSLLAPLLSAARIARGGVLNAGNFSMPSMGE